MSAPRIGRSAPCQRLDDGPLDLAGPSFLVGSSGSGGIVGSMGSSGRASNTAARVRRGV
jgi:hypothetical protein